MTDQPKAISGKGFKETIRPAVAWFCTTVFGAMIRVLNRIRVCNREVLPMEGPLLLAANHISWVDPAFVTIASRRQPVRFLVTRGFHKKPFVYFFCWVYGAIPIDKKNPREAVRAAIEALKQGDLVCIFPEGGLTKDGQTREIMRGVELISRSAKAPVLPVRISGLYGTSLAIRREWRMNHLWKRPWPKVEVKVGTVIPWQEVTKEAVGVQLKLDRTL